MHRLNILLALLVAWPATVGADPMPPGPFKKYKKGVVAWSKPVGGFALLLAPENPTMVEGREPGIDTAARMDSKLLIKNVSKKTLTFQRRVIGAFQLRWEVVDAAGNRWSPTYLPPPMPRAQKYKAHRLAPGKAAVLAHLHGISGFRRAGKADDGRWYGVPSAGTYRVTARGVDLGTVKQKLASGPMTIRVLPANRPVRGLKLQLSTASGTTPHTGKGAGARPVKLTLTFTNVSKKSITLDVHHLALYLLRPHVRGNLSHTKVRRGAPSPRKPGAGFVVLRPGKKYVHSQGLQAPGPLGLNSYRYSGPGWYQLRVEYTRGKPAENGCWTGEVSSDAVWLRVTK